MIYCKNCGRIMEETDAFCAQCGERNEIANSSSKKMSYYDDENKGYDRNETLGFYNDLEERYPFKQNTNNERDQSHFVFESKSTNKNIENNFGDFTSNEYNAKGTRANNMSSNSFYNKVENEAEMKQDYYKNVTNNVTNENEHEEIDQYYNADISNQNDFGFKSYNDNQKDDDVFQQYGHKTKRSNLEMDKYSNITKLNNINNDIDNFDENYLFDSKPKQINKNINEDVFYGTTSQMNNNSNKFVDNDNFFGINNQQPFKRNSEKSDVFINNRTDFDFFTSSELDEDKLNEVNNHEMINKQKMVNKHEKEYTNKRENDFGNYFNTNVNNEKYNDNFVKNDIYRRNNKDDMSIDDSLYKYSNMSDGNNQHFSNELFNDDNKGNINVFTQPHKHENVNVNAKFNPFVDVGNTRKEQPIENEPYQAFNKSTIFNENIRDTKTKKEFEPEENMFFKKENNLSDNKQTAFNKFGLPEELMNSNSSETMEIDVNIIRNSLKKQMQIREQQKLNGEKNKQIDYDEEEHFDLDKDYDTEFKFDFKKIILLALVVIVLIALVFFIGSKIYKKNNNTNTEVGYNNLPIYYTDNDNEYIYFASGKSSVNLNQYDERIVVKYNSMYARIDNNLFLIKDGKTPKLIAEDISNYYVSNLGNSLAYSFNNNLYLNKNEKLVKKIQDNELEGSEIFLDNKKTVIAKKNNDSLYICANGDKFEHLDTNISSVLFLSEGKIFYYKTNNTKSYDIYFASAEIKPIKLFSVKDIADISYDKMNPNGKIIYKDINNKLYLFNGSKIISIFPNEVADYKTNIKEKEIKSIRCLFKSIDNIWYAFDEITMKTLILEGDLIEESNNFETFVCKNSVDKLIIYLFDKKEWKIIDAELNNIVKINLSSDGKTIVFVDSNNALVQYELSKKPIKIADNFVIDDNNLKTSENQGRISFVQDKMLYYYKTGKEAYRIKGNVINFDISKEGKNVIYSTEDKKLFIYLNAKKSVLVCENFKQVINYDTKLIYYIDNNNKLYVYNSLDNKTELIGKNVEQIGSCEELL